MDIILSNSSGKPIYQQIADQVKEQVCSGALAAGDALPSMRLLAKELRISVITTKRAYEELERDGFLENVPGKGCFVAPQNRELLASTMSMPAYSNPFIITVTRTIQTEHGHSEPCL